MEILFTLLTLLVCAAVMLFVHKLQNPLFIDKLVNKMLYTDSARTATALAANGIEFVGVYANPARLVEAVKKESGHYVYFMITRKLHNRDQMEGFRQTGIVVSDNDIYAFRILADRALELGVPQFKDNTTQLKNLLAQYVVCNYGSSFGYGLTTLHSCDPIWMGGRTVTVEKIGHYDPTLAGHVVSSFKHLALKSCGARGILDTSAFGYKFRSIPRFFITRNDNGFLSTLERYILSIEGIGSNTEWRHGMKTAPCRILAYYNPDYLKPFTVAAKEKVTKV